jgi:prolyl oligopeptidase
MTENDPYLWLEEIDSDAALSWVRERNAITLAALETPNGLALRERFEQILNSDAKIPYVTERGGADRNGWWYNFWQDASHERGLWRRCTRASYIAGNPDWQIVLDLDALAKLEGENWVWAGSEILEPECRHALIILSKGGGDAHVIREFDLQMLEFVKDGFVLPEAKSGVSWIDRDTIYLNTDFGPGTLTKSGYARQVKRWKRGTLLEAAELVFEVPENDVWVYAVVERDAKFTREWIVRGKTFHTNELRVWVGNEFVKLEKPDDADADLFNEFLLIRPKTDWVIGETTYPQGALLAINFEAFLAGSRGFSILFAPTPRSSLVNFVRTKNTMVTVRLENVQTKLTSWRFENETWISRALPLAAGNVEVGAVNHFENDELFIFGEDFLTPSILALTDGETLQTLRQLPAMFDATGLKVQQLEATSKDGERIPYFVVHRDDIKLDGQNPTMLYAYGGFQISELPYYPAMAGSAWLERGGVYVLANIRGGGEFGPRWHQAALKHNRQIAFDDFIAVAENLIENGITSSAHLGIQGGSNGGLLVGAVMVQRPDLFGAVVCEVPLLDMKRFHLLLAGASWVDEYGNPDNPDDWAALEKYSPYQNLKPGKPFPKVLFTTSTRDDRVHPGHARKMMARMLEQGHDALYYENIEGGHGGAANNRQRALMRSLTYEFLWQNLT